MSAMTKYDIKSDLCLCLSSCSFSRTDSSCPNCLHQTFSDYNSFSSAIVKLERSWWNRRPRMMVKDIVNMFPTYPNIQKVDLCRLWSSQVLNSQPHFHNTTSMPTYTYFLQYSSLLFFFGHFAFILQLVICKYSTSLMLNNQKQQNMCTRFESELYY